MSWLELAALAGATFFSVFLMGIQSRNVNQGRYLASVVTSFGISAGNFTFARYASTGSMTAFLTSAAGGMTGIAFAIWFYQRFMEKRHGHQPKDQAAGQPDQDRRRQAEQGQRQAAGHFENQGAAA